MKKTALIFILAALMAMSASLVIAEETAAPNKELTGKDLFKVNCKSCHAAKSDAGEYTPMTYIMEQWDEFFDELWSETHGMIVSPQDATKKVTDMIDKDMLKKIRKFCVDHAADSEQPMTCG